MNDRVFLDTNMIIYMYSEDEIKKRDAVFAFVNYNNCFASTQILSEASNVWFKKYSWNKMQIIKYLNGIESVCDEILIIQRKTIDKALELKERYSYSYYDCLILASAFEANCSIILTEDMSHNQIIDGKLQIVNPFDIT